MVSVIHFFCHFLLLGGIDATVNNIIYHTILISNQTTKALVFQFELFLVIFSVSDNLIMRLDLELKARSSSGRKFSCYYQLDVFLCRTIDSLIEQYRKCPKCFFILTNSRSLGSDKVKILTLVHQ